jgi:2-phosphosulfolactate phosphatase
MNQIEMARQWKSIFDSMVIVKVMIKNCLMGARQSRGVVVVVDVFRASNTILMLLAKGVSSILAVASVKEAFRLKRKYPHFLLAGERKGVTIDGFDMGNSPYEASKKNVRDKHVILTTSAGTQGIAHAENAEKILVGSFGNAKALTSALIRINPKVVTLLSVGTEGIRNAVEDEMCSLYIKGILEGKTKEISQTSDDIMKGEGARRLKRLNQEKDFPYCLGTDIFDIIPEVIKTNGMFRIHTLT